MTMHHVEVLLEPSQHRFLLEESRRRGVSPSDVIRQIVDDRMVKAAGDEDPLEALIGIAEGGGDDAARNHDAILYGDPHR
jgi:hypothetical protein